MLKFGYFHEFCNKPVKMLDLPPIIFTIYNIQYTANIQKNFKGDV